MTLNCNICNKPIILIPSAKERAKRYGGSPKDYEKLFPSHANCAIEKREREAYELLRRINKA